jgi:hypothetical protein
MESGSTRLCAGQVIEFEGPNQGSASSIYFGSEQCRASPKGRAKGRRVPEEGPDPEQANNPQRLGRIKRRVLLYRTSV